MKLPDLFVTADVPELVSRCLFKERRVLHRDISKGNVLFGEQSGQLVETAEKLGFCTVLRLLDDRHVQF